MPDGGKDVDSYSVCLMVANECGEVHRDLVVHFNQSGVETLTQASNELTVYPKVFDSEINVVTSSEGNIPVKLFCYEGNCVLANDFVVSADETLKIYPEVASGLYILYVEKDGQYVGIAKVIRCRS